jgi:hypothetical protein
MAAENKTPTPIPEPIAPKAEPIAPIPEPIAPKAESALTAGAIAKLELEAQVRNLIGGTASIEVFANTKDTSGPVGELHARVGKMIFRDPLFTGRIDVQEISTGCWITVSSLDEAMKINP